MSFEHFKIVPHFKKRIGNIQYSFYIYIEINKRKIGIEIPTIKDFDTPKGTSCYYATLRIAEAIQNSIITDSVLIIPERSSGKKFKETAEPLKDSLFIQELNQNKADQICNYEEDMYFDVEEVFILADFIFKNVESKKFFNIISNGIKVEKPLDQLIN